MQRPDLHDRLLRITSPLTSTAFASPFSQVLVPLVLLQALQSEGQSLTTLLHLGVRFLEEDEAGYIIQQGGWVSFKHVIEENHHTYT